MSTSESNSSLLIFAFATLLLVTPSNLAIDLFVDFFAASEVSIASIVDCVSINFPPYRFHPFKYAFADDIIASSASNLSSFI